MKAQLALSAREGSIGEPASEREEAELFDMDGTLANVENIRHHVTGARRDFMAFHAQSVNVPPNDHVVQMARLAKTRGRKVVIVTSRSAEFRPHTAMWLALQRVPSDALYMRSTTDTRLDVEVKRTLYRRLSLRYAILNAVDDNPSILQLWESFGIPTTTVHSSITADPRYQRR